MIWIGGPVIELVVELIEDIWSRLCWRDDPALGPKHARNTCYDHDKKTSPKVSASPFHEASFTLVAWQVIGVCIAR